MKYVSLLFLLTFLLAGNSFAQKIPAELAGEWHNGYRKEQ